MDEFLDQSFDFRRSRKVVTGIDIRTDFPESRLKMWFMLTDYPEKVERAVALHGDDCDVTRLKLHDEFLVGFDFRFDGRSAIKLYPDVRPWELRDPAHRVILGNALSGEALEAMGRCRWTHIYLARHHAGRVLQFHPAEPDEFVARYLAPEMVRPVHELYEGTPLLDMVVSVRERDLADRPIRDFTVYYMPAQQPRQTNSHAVSQSSRSLDP
jgi:LynF/TruF/PatF family peptide O-prenyltransferase